jgi:hypothetical protein
MVQKMKGQMRVYCRVKPIESVSKDTLNETYSLPFRISNIQETNCIQISSVSSCNDLPICLELFQDKEQLTYHLDGIF